MKKEILLFATFCAFVFAGCGSDKQNNQPAEATDKPKSQEGSDAGILQQELSAPLKYLKLTEVKMTKNFTGKNQEYDGWLVEGRINNSATEARYKNVELTITLMSNTGAVIHEEDDVMHKYYGPGTSKSFSVNVYPKAEPDSFVVAVKSALASE